MELRKTVRVKLGGLTRTKEAVLGQEYEAWLRRLRVGAKADGPLYSATVQQADRLRKSLGHRFNRTGNYPMVLRRDCFRLEKARHTTHSGWWLKVPVSAIRGGLWLPVELAPSHATLLDDPDLSLREARLIPRRGHWAVHIVVERSVPAPSLESHPNVLAVDMGERNPATAVLIAPGASVKPMYLGREVRGVRRHHAWLRKRLQEKRAFRTIKAQRNRESRRVGAILHPAINRLVAVAKENRATIVIGDFSGGHRNTRKGRRFNRIVNSMPFARIRGMVLDKAGWAGVPVVLVDEAYTSRECHRCHNIGKRDRQAEFQCLSGMCGWRGNADMNGALNIGDRWERPGALVGLGGAASTRPMNPAG